MVPCVCCLRPCTQQGSGSGLSAPLTHRRVIRMRVMHPVPENTLCRGAAGWAAPWSLQCFLGQGASWKQFSHLKRKQSACAPRAVLVSGGGALPTAPRAHLAMSEGFSGSHNSGGVLLASRGQRPGCPHPAGHRTSKRQQCQGWKPTLSASLFETPQCSVLFKFFSSHVGGVIAYTYLDL